MTRGDMAPERALHAYRDGFLETVAPLLSAEQLVLLRSYEATQFAAPAEDEIRNENAR